MNRIIQAIKHNGIKSAGSGSACDANDFFEQVVKPQFANKQAIKATHQALMEYVHSDNAVICP